MRIIRNLLFVLVTLEPSQILAESIENLNDNVADWVMIQPGNSRTFEDKQSGSYVREDSIGLSTVPLVSGGSAYPVYSSDFNGVGYVSISNGYKIHKIVATEYISGHGDVEVYVEMNPPLQIAHATIQPGQRVTSTGALNYVIPSLGESFAATYTSISELLGFEEIVTPLGNFLAAKISSSLSTISSDGSASTESVSWFVEGLGEVKFWDVQENKIEIIRETSIPESSFDSDGDGYGNNIELLNSEPVLSSKFITMNEGEVYLGSLSASDSDNDILNYSIQSTPSDGTVVLDGSDASFIYTPNEYFSGSDSFTVLVSDTAGGSDTAIINVRINEVNEPPVASDSSISIQEDTNVLGGLSVIDSDAEDTHTFEVITSPQHGTVILNGGHYTYTSAQNYNGLDTFEYRATDNSGDSDTATVNIAIAAVNDAPIATGKWVELNDRNVTSSLDGYDVDGDDITYEINETPEKGTVQLIDVEAGSFLYESSSNVACSDKFSYRARDESGEYSNSATVTVQLPAPEEVDSDLGTVELCSGWNLFSTAIGDTAEVEQLFGGALEAIYPNQQSTIDPLQGYWVKLSEDVTLDLSSTSAATWSGQGVPEGWSLIGPTEKQSVEAFVSALEAGSGKKVNRVIQYSNRHGWEQKDLERALGTLSQVHPNLGYAVQFVDDGGGNTSTGLSKISSSGALLDDVATEWSCVRDNETGLIWEVKTDDDDTHDKDNEYRWGGAAETAAGEENVYGDWDELINGSNGESFCGYNDWRVPTKDELREIVVTENSPTINTDYFPNTLAAWFWSSSPNASSVSYAWRFSFNIGYDDNYYRSVYYRVRLVRGGQ